MARLTDQEIAAHVLAAGFTGDQAVTAVAVALAESGGDPKARNRNTDGSVDRGLFQINGKAHPDVSDAAADDPAQAAKAAYKISNRGTNFRPWVAYTNGSYRKFLARAGQAVGLSAAIGGVGGGLAGAGYSADSGIAGLAKAVSSVASVIVKAGTWIGNPRNWVRVAEVFGGAVAVVIAVNLIARSGATGPVAEAARMTSKATKTVTSKAQQAATMAATRGAAGAPSAS